MYVVRREREKRGEEKQKEDEGKREKEREERRKSWRAGGTTGIVSLVSRASQ